jgi:hypothetical protein
VLQKILRNPLDSARAVIGGSEKATEKWKKIQNQKIPALSPVNSWFKAVRGGAGGKYWRNWTSLDLRVCQWLTGGMKRC